MASPSILTAIVLDALPKDLLAESLSFLDLVTHVRLRSVSSKFDKAVVCSLQRVKRIPTSRFGERTPELRRGIVRTLSELCRSITELTDLGGTELAADLVDIFRARSHALTKLHSLQAHKLNFVATERYPELQFPVLTDLSMYCMYAENYGPPILENVLSRCPKLSRFAVIAARFTTRDLEAVVRTRPNLTSLAFFARFMIDFSLRPLKDLRHLTTLEVHSLSTGQAHGLARSCPGLKNLALGPWGHWLGMSDEARAQVGLNVLEILGESLLDVQCLAVEFSHFNGRLSSFGCKMQQQPYSFPRLKRLVCEHARQNCIDWDADYAEEFAESRPGVRVVYR